MSIHRFEPPEPHPTEDTSFDEREWQLQERALRDERDGSPTGDDPAVVDYRRVVRALRAPLAVDLPPDFAAQVAARVAARHAAESRLEQVLTHALLGALALAAVVVSMQYGGSWLRDGLALLPSGRWDLGLQWGLAVMACLGLSWSMEQWRRRTTPHH
jgi:hypothetical protein